MTRLLMLAFACITLASYSFTSKGWLGFTLGFALGGVYFTIKSIVKTRRMLQKAPTQIKPVLAFFGATAVCFLWAWVCIEPEDSPRAPLGALFTLCGIFFLVCGIKQLLKLRRAKKELNKTKI